MKNNLTKKLFLLIGIMCVLALAACSGDKNPSTTDSEKTDPDGATNNQKTIFVGVTNSIGSINPINSQDALARRIIGVFFDPLYDVNEAMEFTPKLAESFETEDNQSFTITIRKEANWTDGKPITTEDVLFTLNLMANPDVQSRGLRQLNIIEGLDENGYLVAGETSIKGIEIKDEKTFIVRTKRAVDENYLKENLGYYIPIIPKHVLENADPAELHQHPFMTNPDVTSGAFKFVKLDADSYMELAANKDYYRGAPKIDKLFFKVMPSANIVAQLQTGEVHMNAPGVGNIAIQDYEKVKNMSNIQTTQGKAFNYQMMYFNMDTFDDPNVRRAIVHGINRPMIVENLLKGEGGVIDGPFTTAHPYYNEDINVIEYDPNKAKQLLEEANWDFSKPINLNVPAGNQTREQAGAIIAENLRAIGLNVQINKLDLPTILQKAAKKEFDLSMLGIPLQIDPGTNAGLFFRKGGQYNYSEYDNPKVEGLLNEGASEPDPEKRKKIYDEFQLIIQQDLPTISLYEERVLKAASKNLEVAEPKDYGMFYNVNEWDIKE